MTLHCPRCGCDVLAANPKPVDGLTRQQNAMLTFIRSYELRTGEGPRTSDIVKAFGYSARGAMYHILRPLRDAGLVALARHRVKTVAQGKK